MSTESFKLGIEIIGKPGPLLKPTAVKIHDGKPHHQHYTNSKEESLTEALVGLAVCKLHGHTKVPLVNPHTSFNFINLAWRTLDPHFELYWRTQSYLRELTDQTTEIDPHRIMELEKAFDEIVESAHKPWGIDLEMLLPFLDRIESFEERVNSPYIFNFSLKFSNQFIEKLHALYSMLYHLRSVVGIDHNRNIKVSTHDSVRVDSISDYIDAAEYIANDAAIYHNFKKLSHPFRGHKSSDTRFEKLFIDPLQRSFQSWNHNACCLIDNIPASILNSIKSVGIEDEFYRIQMNWLLGAPAGLLFRVREELFGLAEGYEQVFWTDLEGYTSRGHSHLHLDIRLTETDVFGGINNKTVA